MPQRQAQEVPADARDVAALLNYYEHLVQEWELWGETVSSMMGKSPSE